ncbi:hypothetical protein CSUI_007936 [Cystoisospora suis]|uniref:Uncharacterized protein n=1 Tax=Cystoisospora suis TaxID=483139 RepID=A0A2C6KNQ2_9APIC|nr:hypothetical protein CSUI_007936 [Cystoisospora suis]
MFSIFFFFFFLLFLLIIHLISLRVLTTSHALRFIFLSAML